MIMKQTLEEAVNSISGVHPDWSRLECFRKGFKEGAKWHAKQSLWIKTKERLPEDSQEVLILMKYITPCTKVIRYQIVQCTYLKAFGMEVFESHKEKVIGWMPIPSFDEILEANRDVLERIKEKGD